MECELFMKTVKTQVGFHSSFIFFKVFGQYLYIVLSRLGRFQLVIEQIPHIDDFILGLNARFYPVIPRVICLVTSILMKIYQMNVINHRLMLRTLQK